MKFNHHNNCYINNYKSISGMAKKTSKQQLNGKHVRQLQQEQSFC